MRPENLLMRVLVLGHESFGLGGSMREAIDKLSEFDDPVEMCAVALDLGADWQMFETPFGDIELPGAVVGFVDLGLKTDEDERAVYLDS